MPNNLVTGWKQSWPNFRMETVVCNDGIACIQQQTLLTEPKTTTQQTVMLTKTGQNTTWPTLWSLLALGVEWIASEITVPGHKGPATRQTNSRISAGGSSLWSSSLAGLHAASRANMIDPNTNRWPCSYNKYDSTTSLPKPLLHISDPGQAFFFRPQSSQVPSLARVAHQLEEYFMVWKFFLSHSLNLLVRASRHLQKLDDICLTAHAFTERWSLHHPLVLREGMTKGCHGIQNKAGHTSNEIWVSSHTREAPIWAFGEKWAINWSSQSI